MEIVEGEFPAWCQAAAFQQGRKPYAQSFLSERSTSGVTQSRKLFPLKKSPVPKHGGIFLFHLIVIVLIQASCEVEEGRGVGGVD